MNTSKVIPVVVISGFLGSGKTTLLRRWIDRLTADGLRPAVVMNELGEVNLDGQIVGDDVPMAELLGGCICCTFRGDLGLTLARIAEEERPDAILIESTGAANPMELIDGITEASLYDTVALRQVVIVVDGPQLLELHAQGGKGKTYRLMEEQIRCADVLLLNKSDRLTPDELSEAERIVRAWNGKAGLIRTIRCEVDIAELERAAEGTHGRREQAYAPAEGHQRERSGGHGGHAHAEGQQRGHLDGHEGHAHAEGQQGERSGDRRDHAHAGSEHAGDRPHAHVHGAAHDHASAGHAHGTHDHVMVYTHYLDGPVDSTRFERFIAELPQSVYRAKGILRFTDTASRYLFQLAYRQTDYMAITPQKDVPDVLVLIGEHMPVEPIQSALSELYAE